MIETQYTLGSFGLRKEDLPVDDYGNVGRADDWVAFRRSKESWLNGKVSSSNESIENHWPELARLNLDVPGLSPQPEDVLMGERTVEVKRNPGNVYYRQLVEEKVTEYQETRSSKAKGKLRDYVIAKLKERGGRFLTREAGQGWREVEEALVQKRVNQAFRNHRRNAEG